MKFICDVKGHEAVVTRSKDAYKVAQWKCKHCGKIPEIYLDAFRTDIIFEWE